MQIVKPSSFPWSKQVKIYLLWLAVAGVSSALALLVTISYLQLARVDADRDMVLPIILPLAFFPAIGQCLVLWRFLPRAWMWLLATAGGWLAAAGILALMAKLGLSGVFYDQHGTQVTLNVLGSCLGLFQWLALRPYYHRAGWWILSSLLGWLAVGFLGGEPFNMGINLFILFGAIPAFFTGLVLIYLLQRPRILSSDHSNPSLPPADEPLSQ
jgi:hypothetical protein